MLDYIWLVLFFPLLGVVINGLFSKFLTKRFTDFVSCGTIGISFLSSFLILYSLLQLSPEQRSFEKTLFPWIVSGDFKALVSFLVDPLSALMILVVSGVSFIIHIYSIGYMEGDKGYSRYFAYLNLFTFSMLLLVLANNFLLMYIGWEGVGLCSYLLIGFWYERRSASDAGKKAFIVNRIGDFGFGLGIILIYVTFKDLNYTFVFHSAPKILPYGGFTITAITLLLFLGAIGKSAQIPLYVWLPDAMEGPTPVSALIHAATMVTAGVYMVARTSVLYLMAPLSMNAVMLIGVLTAIYAASIALAQNDIKRVLAYSTISQLGYMFLALGVGAFAAGIFHLMTHAFFKALLFLAAGSVIHSLGGEQDMKKMGGLKKYMPTTYWTFIIAALALAGIFPFAGFFSKDQILWEVFVKRGTLVCGIGIIAAFLTSFYIFRLIFLTFYGESRIAKEKREHIHESPNVILYPLIILAVFSAIAGFVGMPLIKGANIIGEFLAPVFDLRAASIHIPETIHHSLGLEILFMVISLLIAVFGIFLAFKFYVKEPALPRRLAERYPALYQLLFNKYYIDEFYDFIIVNPLKNTALFFWKGFDVFIIDGLVNNIASFIKVQSETYKRLQTGYIRNYALYMVIGCIFIMAYYFFR
ncbi:MAG TPA: NADH-quinone oxidoreductase subunit L [Nitrospinota bacterium]|nr:NADH-quinone oxidoreductase subunit L [Nitrospinota bacterium]